MSHTILFSFIKIQAKKNFSIKASLKKTKQNKITFFYFFLQCLTLFTSLTKITRSTLLSIKIIPQNNELFIKNLMCFMAKLRQMCILSTRIALSMNLIKILLKNNTLLNHSKFLKIFLIFLKQIYKISSRNFI